MADYNIRVRIDPTDAQSGRQVVRAELQGIQQDAAATNTALDRAMQFNTGPAVAGARRVDKALDEVASQAQATGAAVERALDFSGIRPNFAPIVTSLNGLGASATTVGATFNRDLNFTRGSTVLQQQLGAVEREVESLRAQVIQLQAQLAATPNGGRGGPLGPGFVPSAGQQRQAMIQLGQQFNDFSTQVLLGGSVVTAFAAQSGQAAFALSNMGGFLGTVGRFLAGPWGTFVIIGTTILATFVGEMLKSKDATDEAEKALRRFMQRQMDIGNFIDATTGKLKEQNRTLIQNAILLRQAQIAENDKKIKEGSGTAFARATKLADDAVADPFVERGMSPKFLDPEISTVIVKAKGNVEALDLGLQALARRRPALRGVINEISTAAATTVVLSRENAKLRGEVDQLTGRTTAQTTATSAAIERNVALATATNSVERAQARLSIVRARGAEIDKIDDPKARATALQQYARDLTAATGAVNSATAAQRAGRAATSEHNKELRAQAALAERVSDFLAKLKDQGDALERRGVDSAIETQVDAFTRQFNRKPTGGENGERAQIEAQVRRIQLLTDEKSILDGLLGPLETYQRQLAALNDLLARGKITQDQYNQSLRDLPLAQAVDQIDKSLSGTLLGYQAQVKAINDAIDKAIETINIAERAGILRPDEAAARRKALGERPNGDGDIIVNGGPPRNRRDQELAALRRQQMEPLRALDKSLGGKFGENEEVRAIREQAEDRLKVIRELRDQELLDDEEFNKRKVAIAEDRERQIDAIEQARIQMRLAAAQEATGALLDVAKAYAGEQSGIYKAIFAVDKAFAIAQAVLAIQTNIAQASKVGFPANIPFIAAAITQGASILTNIKAVSAAFAQGGYVDGPGGPTDDRILARLSAGEFVVNASATSRNRGALEAINAGRTAAPAAAAPIGGRPAMNVRVHNYAGVAVETRQTGDGDLDIRINRAIDKRAPSAVAKDMTNRNGPVQKAMRRTTTARTEKV